MSNTEKAIELIRAERARQIVVEGWTAEDDDRTNGELGDAAACYAMREQTRMNKIWDVSVRFRIWKLSLRMWKPTPDNRMRELVKAGALILAEMERLMRQESKTSQVVVDDPTVE